MKKTLSIVLSLAIILSSLALAPVNALAAVSDPGTLDSNTLEFWADPENTIKQSDITAYSEDNKTTMVGAVAAHKRASSENNYYLFLPSNADCNNLKLWFTASSASVDGVAVSNGEASDVFKDINAGAVVKTYSVKLDSNTYSVTAVKSGDVGTVYIDTESGSIAKINNSENKTASEGGTIMVTEPDGTVDYDGVLSNMKGRGNATWSAKGTKNPYNIKIDKKAALLGMGKSKKWCLIANAGDNTLIKNQLTYDFAEYIGIRYQVIGKPVDLYVNQQYLGSYLLTEKVEVGSNRVEVTDAYENLEEANAYTDPDTGKKVTDLEGRDVSKIKEFSDEKGTEVNSTSMLNPNSQQIGMRKYSPALKSPEDVSGGYLFELEISNRWEDEGAGFCGYNRQGWVLKSCDYASKDMVNYSYDLFYALGGAVYNGGTVPSKTVVTDCSDLGYEIIRGPKKVTNPAPKAQYRGKKWSELLDCDNMDSSVSSTYFYKDSDSVDSKLYAGPMWDMDEALGYDKEEDSRWGYSYTSPDGWYTKNTRIYRWRATDSTTTYDTDKLSPRSFYGALATNCGDFWACAKTYWFDIIEPATQVLLGNKTDDTGVLHSVDYYANTVAKSGKMNNIRHDKGNDYDAKGISSGIKKWLSSRADWLSADLSKHVHTPASAVKEKVSATSYDEVVYCTSCKKEISRKTVKVTSKSGFAPGKAKADAAKENSKIKKVKISSTVNANKKTVKVKFKKVKGTTNYRLRYRKAGTKKWSYAWTCGKGSYTVKKLKKNGAYQIQVAPYVYKKGKWQRGKYSNVNYCYVNAVKGVKAAPSGKKIKVKWNADKKASGYDVAYAKSKSAKKTVKTVKGAKKKAKALKMKKKGTYYIFVRSYKTKGGKKYTGSWIAKKVKVK